MSNPGTLHHRNQFGPDFRLSGSRPQFRIGTDTMLEHSMCPGFRYIWIRKKDV